MDRSLGFQGCSFRCANLTFSVNLANMSCKGMENIPRRRNFEHVGYAIGWHRKFPQIEYHSIHNDYRQTFPLRAINSNYRYRIVPPKKKFQLQRRICGNVGRKSLITDAEPPLKFNLFPLQIQTSGSKQINSVIISATTVCHFLLPGGRKDMNVRCHTEVGALAKRAPM